MAFTISIDGEERAFDEQERAELSTYIVDVACARADFLILTNDQSDEYIQCAEADRRLLVERRDRRGGSFKHYQVVREGGSREKLPPRVEGYEGYERRAVLDIEDAEGLFEEFLSGQPIGARFEALDMTDELERAAQSAGDARGNESKGFLGKLKKLFGG